MATMGVKGLTAQLRVNAIYTVVHKNVACQLLSLIFYVIKM